MRFILIIGAVFVLSACSSQNVDTAENSSTAVEPSHSSVESVGANSTETTAPTVAGEASNSSVDTIGANEATSETTTPVIDPEVDAMFGQLIRQSIANGNEQQALKLVEDAEQAGSLKARDVYLQALEKQKEQQQ
ncbi:hypothetical protein OAG1_29640 [Agarivorans sp. OAG1]|uniref:hypothetical protein n=1 Tax=Agarivorans sp. OAG1 TaxID=3082387 RepID=UPI002B2E76E2|nr:hypothetical protein OAG1_29640 [Agarivorans sp. OAG1]